MPVLRTLITGINVTRNVNTAEEGEIVISNKSKINDLKKAKIVDFDIVDVYFSMETEYKPDLGKIKIDGVMQLGGDMKDLVAEEGGKLALKPEGMKEIHQKILTSPMLLAIILAREVSLPMPIRLPSVELNK